MSRAQDMVAEFHRATGATIGDTPAIRDDLLRIKLIHEEMQEFAEALGYWPNEFGDGYVYKVTPDLVKAIDALADLLYVVYGAAVTFGIDLDPFLAEVHRSNMTKIGGPVREDGKRLKPDTYEPPNLEPILRAQRVEAAMREIDGIYEGMLPRERAVFREALSDFEADGDYDCTGEGGCRCL